jgi:hypothetical protein
MVRTADAAVANIRSEAASLQSQIDVIDSQIGLRELDRRAAAAKSQDEEIAAKRRALTEEVEAYLGSIADADVLLERPGISHSRGHQAAVLRRGEDPHRPGRAAW